MTILATIVLLGVLILVHELGHFWAAKAVGVGVERFSIGLGPRLWGFERGGTEYVISVIPLGGYVRMQGMDDEVMEAIEGGGDDDAAAGRGEASASHREASASRTRREEASASATRRREQASATATRRPDGNFDSKSIGARAFVISAGVIMNMLFAFVLYTAVPVIWGYSDVVTTRVMAVTEELLPAGTGALAGLPPGSEVVRVGGEEVETWGDVRRGFLEASPGPLAVETRNPSRTLEISVPAGSEERAALANALQFWVDAVVGRITAGSPAEAASLEPGDRILSVEGVPVGNWAEMVREVEARPGERVELGVRRGEAELIRVVELESVSAGEARQGRLGVYQEPVEVVTASVSPLEAVQAGWQETERMTRVIVTFLGRLVSGRVSPREVGSIGTIAVMAGETASVGLATFLEFMALFSINLAILNLLPIPILDGGHLVFLTIELVRGRKLSVEQQVRWSKVGLWVVLGIMVWALSNDILRFLGL